MSQPMKKPTRDDLIQLITVIARVPKDGVKMESDLRTDLAMDSLAALDLFVSIEEQFGLVVKQDEAARLKTVGDIVAYVEKM
ncbi:MAG: acyl carrier protein [Bdellovibrionota bacterium]